MNIPKAAAPVDRDHTRRATRQPLEVFLPGSLVQTPVGLGDLVTRVSSSVGFRPCGGCQARAEALNHWVVLSPQRRGG